MDNKVYSLWGHANAPYHTGAAVEVAAEQQKKEGIIIEHVAKAV